MLNCSSFFQILLDNDIGFFSGVPDSLLKNFLAYIADACSKKRHVITANEGNAVALAVGYHLATGKYGAVYMQNSGLGNSANPLISLADKDVYSIPLLLIIGWRGEPGKKDEPQHVKQGKITEQLCSTLGIPYSILPDTLEEVEKVVKKAISCMHTDNSPYALIVRKGTFESYTLKTIEQTSFDLTREEAIKLVISSLEPEDIVVSTTGKTSRELFEIREELNQGHMKDFLTVGSMGHSSHIALGIALAKPERDVYCLDGDGALIMHMGGLGVIASMKPANFKHIVLNNGVHDSVGGQKTVGYDIDFPGIARASGYESAYQAETKENIIMGLNRLKSSSGPALLEIRVNKGARSDLGRPTTTPVQNKQEFVKFVQK